MRRQSLQHPIVWRVCVAAGVFGVIAAWSVFSATPSGTPDPTPAPVWPLPPDPPRVKYLHSITQPHDAGAKQSTFRRFSNWVTGAHGGDESFSKPFGVALDDHGNLCVTDTGAKTVSCFDESTRRWQSWSGAGKLKFSAPVAVAKKGNILYVADSELGSIVAFGTDGKLRFQINHDLDRPSGLTIVGDHLYVADVLRHCVAVFDLKGKFISRFGKRGVGQGEFNFPSHIATDASKHLLVTDSMNNRIQIFDADGTFQGEIGSSGDTPGHFGRPKGVAVDPRGHIYVVDAAFENVQIFNREGRLLLNFGTSGSAPGEFWLPGGIAIGPDNRIYVADSYNRRLQVFQYVGQD